MTRLYQAIGFGLAFLAIYAYGAVRYPLDPALGRTAAFERHYRFVPSFPSVASYLLYVPEAYDPARAYPLVLSLHGASQRAFEAAHLSGAVMQGAHPAFVLLPMAPPYWGWVNQDGSPGALNFALRALAEVEDRYAIDAKRIYVTGHSMGGTGTFAALALYPGRFAAGVAVNGHWPPERAAALKDARLWVFHGELDRLFPLEQARDLVAAVKTAGGAPKFTVMTGVGHQSPPAYERGELWAWLFNQRLGR